MCYLEFIVFGCGDHEVVNNEVCSEESCDGVTGWSSYTTDCCDLCEMGGWFHMNTSCGVSNMDDDLESEITPPELSSSLDPPHADLAEIAHEQFQLLAREMLVTRRKLMARATELTQRTPSGKETPIQVEPQDSMPPTGEDLSTSQRHAKSWPQRQVQLGKASLMPTTDASISPALDCSVYLFNHWRSDPGVQYVAKALASSKEVVEKNKVRPEHTTQPTLPPIQQEIPSNESTLTSSTSASSLAIHESNSQPSHDISSDKAHSAKDASISKETWRQLRNYRETIKNAKNWEILRNYRCQRKTCARCARVPFTSAHFRCRGEPDFTTGLPDALEWKRRQDEVDCSSASRLGTNTSAVKAPEQEMSYADKTVAPPNSRYPNSVLQLNAPPKEVGIRTSPGKVPTDFESWASGLRTNTSAVQAPEQEMSYADKAMFHNTVGPPNSKYPNSVLQLNSPLKEVGMRTSPEIPVDKVFANPEELTSNKTNSSSTWKINCQPPSPIPYTNSVSPDLRNIQTETSQNKQLLPNPYPFQFTNHFSWDRI
ncbi:MAG: hypothetical protein M1812_007154, partial [Candelaria pacifica]